MLEKFKEMEGYTLSWLARCRWNVLDMISVIGHGSVPTCLLYEVDMTWAEDLRAKLKSMGYRTTVTAILLKAIAIAQRAHPLTRTVLLPFGRTAVFNKIVAGFTVERVVDNHFAVFFGAIDDPDRKPLIEIASELKKYGEDDICSVPKLALEDRFNRMPWLFRRVILWLGLRHPDIRLHYMGATFGLSSLGMHGCKVLIPPCVSTSTFGVGEVEEKAVVVNGKIEIRPIMSLVLNFDHRVIDGAPAARFMQEVTSLIQGGLEEHVREEVERIALGKAQAVAVS